jgi:hypothetical protein
MSALPSKADIVQHDRDVPDVAVLRSASRRPCLPREDRPLAPDDVERGGVAVCVAHLPRSRCFGAMAGTSCERHGFYERVSKTRGWFYVACGTYCSLSALRRSLCRNRTRIAGCCPQSRASQYSADLVHSGRSEQNGVILGVSLRVSQLDKSQSGG